VPEELAVDQASRESGAIDGNQRPAFRGLRLWIGRGDQRLPGSGLPEDENGRVVGRHLSVRKRTYLSSSLWPTIFSNVFGGSAALPKVGDFDLQPVLQLPDFLVPCVGPLVGAPPEERIGEDLPQEAESRHNVTAPGPLGVEGAARHDACRRPANPHGDGQQGLDTRATKGILAPQLLLRQILGEPGEHNVSPPRNVSVYQASCSLSGIAGVGGRPGIANKLRMCKRVPSSENCQRLLPIHVRNSTTCRSPSSNLTIHLCRRKVDESRRKAGNQHLELEAFSSASRGLGGRDGAYWSSRRIALINASPHGWVADRPARRCMLAKNHQQENANRYTDIISGRRFS